MNHLFDGDVLLLSGASGIAAATARIAAEQGARICFVSLHGEECLALRLEISSITQDCEHVVGDVADPETAGRAVNLCVERFGRLDMLFNVAGISGRRYGDGPLDECTDEGFEATLRGNLHTVFQLSRAGVRQMLKQDEHSNGLRGTILNMATVTAYSPQRDFFATHAYAAAKGGVIALTRAMASYYAPHKIRVNAIAPGLVRTPMSQRAQADAEILGYMKRKQPLAGTLVEAEDVARTALMLLSNATRMVTGQVLSVDAGWSVSG